MKQGCPISPLIFNLAIEGLIRGIQSSAARGYSFGEALEVKCLAYSDDLAIAASREEDVRIMLTRLEFSRWANLDFNVAKCASLSTTYRGGKREVLQQCFTLKGQAIPVMTWEDHYKHLGVLLGPNPDSCLEKLADNFREDTKKLFQSGLADWMKLEAFREFVMPKLDYAMRSTLAHKNWALKLDKYVRQTVKQALRLPRRTCDAVFYVPAAKGGHGHRSIADELGNVITQATKMLTSPDPLVRGIATHSLDCTILKRYGNTEGPEDRWRFLSGQLWREDEGRRGDISSVWSRVRSFTTTVKVRASMVAQQNLRPRRPSQSVRETSLGVNSVERSCEGCGGGGTGWDGGLGWLNREGWLDRSVGHLSPTTGSGSAATCGTGSIAGHSKPD